MEIWLLIMKKVFLIFIALTAGCLAPAADGFANVRYVVAKEGDPAPPDGESAGLDAGDEYAPHRVYIYGGYDMHFANGAQGLKIADSKGGLTLGLGFKFTDVIRVELSYDHFQEDYGIASSAGDFGFLNFIFDAKMPAQYRLFRTSPFVPFVGFGVGMGKYSELELKNQSAAYDFVGGISMEINRTLAIVLTYKYIALLPNELMVGGAAVKDFAPSGHNVGGAFRINF